METPIDIVADKVAFDEALRANGLFYVAMINTCTFDTPSQALEAHLLSFERQVGDAQKLSPVLINSHSGCDLWSFETSKVYFTEALRIERERGLRIAHETHRGRILYNPWVQFCTIFYI